MAEKKKGKQRKIEEEKPTKEEYAVAKYLRFNLPVREGKLHGMEVKCFFGNAAVDKLLESKWSATKNKKDPLFTNRHSCVAYMLRLLEMGLFHRAEKELRKRDKDRPKKKKKDKDGEKEEAGPVEEELRERKVKKDKKGRKDKDGEATADEEAEKKGEAEKKVEKKDDKKKKEKRLKLIMPERQFFEDGDEVYVWIYDPVNAKTFLIGLLMVLGAIALCMFPLWPEEVRVGVYYLSIALACFVGFILSLVVVRLILFCLIWVLTLGKHHFWLLPNLTEDVGFFDSFRPLYKHDVVSKTDDSKSTEGGKKKKKQEKDGNKKHGGEEKKEKSSDKDDSDEFELIKKEDLDQNGAKDGNDNDNEEIDEADNDKVNDDVENDYVENGAGEEGYEDEDNDDDDQGDGEEKGSEEETEENNSELDKDQKKKTK